MTDHQIAHQWLHWEDEPGVAVLDSGWKVEINPGDLIFVEYEITTGDVIRILEHKKRTLQ